MREGGREMDYDENDKEEGDKLGDPSRKDGYP